MLKVSVELLIVMMIVVVCIMVSGAILIDNIWEPLAIAVGVVLYFHNKRVKRGTDDTHRNR